MIMRSLSFVQISPNRDSVMSTVALETLVVRRLSVGTVMKIYLILQAATLLVYLGVLTYSLISSVIAGETIAAAASALLVLVTGSLVALPIAAVALTIYAVALFVILWLYSKFWPMGISFYPLEERLERDARQGATAQT